MKKILDCISIALFFCIVAMFAASDIKGAISQSDFNLQNNLLHSEKTAADNFPLSDNWKSLYSSLVIATGQSKIGDVYASQERLIEVFDDYDEKLLNNSIESINAFYKKHKKIPMYAMIVPTASGIYSADLPVFASAVDQRTLIDDIYYKLNSNIVTLDAYSALFTTRDDYNYYKTDTHWTAFGAYEAYKATAAKMGIEPLTMQSYDVEYADRGFLGNLYDKTFFRGVDADSIHFFKNKNGSFVTDVTAEKGEQTFSANTLYYEPALRSDDKYGFFLGGDVFKKVTVKTSLKDSPKLLIIKGSYANCFVPFLTAHYSEITLVDTNLLEDNESLSELVNVNDYDRILFLFDVQDFSSRKSLYRINE